MRLPILVALLLWGAVTGVWGQSLQILRYVPGDYRLDNRHRVDLQNGTGKAVSLGGWLLVTRDYSIVFPKNTRLEPGGVLSVVKFRSSEIANDQFELGKSPDFLIRIRDRKNEGNLVALINPEGKIQDGFFFCPNRSAPFLPDRDSNISGSGMVRPYQLPGPGDPIWGYVAVGEDPVIAFEQLKGDWRLSSVKSNLHPATRYQGLNLRYGDGLVTVRWVTEFEDHCTTHKVERSEDQVVFQEVGEVQAVGNNSEIHQYAWTDPVPPGKTYYYRIKNEDLMGNQIVSIVREVSAREGESEFAMEIISTPGFSQEEPSIRFFSQYSQNVRILLLNEKMGEVEILFSGYVNAETGHLLKLETEVPMGRYWVVGETESRRFFSQWDWTPK